MFDENLYLFVKKFKFRSSKLIIICFIFKIKYFALFKVGEVKISCFLSFILFIWV